MVPYLRHECYGWASALQRGNRVPFGTLARLQGPGGRSSLPHKHTLVGPTQTCTDGVFKVQTRSGEPQIRSKTSQCSI
ncbi:hypothetical protein DPEC_G00229240 [Dallia pectoralis]|uniref:Uncharacterized protein n=1 Tax=Dallia pectoralis TaxID=75939 RepID=A0ACC2G1U6_DALPE|nr:hypothetical protein DPEC_G00229240 [Dallia pectoralis]